MPVWAFNSSFGARKRVCGGRLDANLGHQILGKVWTIIYCWKDQDVYFPTQLRARQLGFCSSRKSTLSAGGLESNSICNPFSASESDLCSDPSISARKYLKLQKNTQTHSKVQKCDFCIKTNKNIIKSN